MIHVGPKRASAAIGARTRDGSCRAIERPVARRRGRRASADRRGIRRGTCHPPQRRGPDDVARLRQRPGTASRPRRRARAATDGRHPYRPGSLRRTGRPRTTPRRDRALACRCSPARPRTSAGRSGRPASMTGSIRYQRPGRRRPDPWRPGTRLRDPGATGRTQAVVAMSAIPPRAATAGPARRNQRDSTMVDGPPPAAGRWREEGEVGHRTQRPFTATYRGAERGHWQGPPGRVCYAPRRRQVERRVVAKPVRFRHSPATVNRPRAEVRSPTSRCMLEPSRER